LKKITKLIRKDRTSSSRKLGLKLKVSHVTAQKLRKNAGFIRRKKIQRPIMTKKHMENRLKFAKKHMKCSWKRWVFLDEKWFECFRNKGYYWKTKDEDPVFEHTASKRFPPKVMFLAAVSKGAHDGKIGLYPCVEQCTYQRNSKHHKKGEQYLKDVEVTSKFYAKLISEKVFPDIVKKLGDGKVIVQHDNPKPHKGEEVDCAFRKYSNFVNQYQPAQSPDLNPLDQGIFKMLADAVEKKQPTTRDSLIDCVNKAWKEIPTSKIVSTINNNNIVCKKIIEMKGGNKF